MVVMIYRVSLDIMDMMRGLGQGSRAGFIMHTIDRIVIVIVGLGVFELQAGVDHHTRRMTLRRGMLRVLWLMRLVVERLLLMWIKRRGWVAIPLLTADSTVPALGRWFHH